MGKILMRNYNECKCCGNLVAKREWDYKNKKNYQPKLCQKCRNYHKTFIQKLKENIREEMRVIPPEFNKEKTMGQVDMIMWQEIDTLAGEELSK